jgi:fructokinase
VAWRNFSWRDALTDALEGVPLVLTTDTNAAAWAEYATRHDGARQSLAYVTVGTGIGGGLILDGALAGTRAHPELGHQRVTRHPSDLFDGVCPSHGDCLEGLASGPAIAARWGQPAPELPATHPAWDLEAYYLGQGLANIAYFTRVPTIVVGGGVSRAPGLIERVRLEFDRELAGYFDSDRERVRGADVIAPPRLGDRAGVVGAYLLAGGR